MTKPALQELDAETQIFTPPYVAKYLAQNSIGRLWAHSKPTSSITDNFGWYVTSTNPPNMVTVASPEEIRVLYAIPEGPPAQFVWRRQTLRAARFAGPERIAPEWWRDRPGVRLRDYFRIEDEHGRRLWIFREGMAGDGRGGAPRWFLHGVFA